MTTKQQDTEDLVNLLLATFNARDLENFMPLFHEDAVCKLDTETVVKGRAAIQKLFGLQLDHYDIRFLSWIALAAEDRGAFEAKVRITYVKTVPGLMEAEGQTTEMPVAGFIDFRDGLVQEVRILRSFVDWLRVLV